MKIALIRLTVLGFGLAAAASFVTGCDRGSAQSLTPPPTVTIEPVEQKQIVEWSEFTGHTEPVDSVDIRPRVSGYIQKVEFQSGQLVKKGDVLFVIDPRWNQAVFDQRQAEYDQARSEAERIDLLLENHAISKEEADGRKARYEEAKAALDSARLDLDYTQVRAPIDGRVSRALLTEGNYVSGVPGSASLLTTIVSVGPIYVYADMDENSLLKFNALVAVNKMETNAEGKIPCNCNSPTRRISRMRATSNRWTISWIPTPAASFCARFFPIPMVKSCRDCLREFAFR